MTQDQFKKITDISAHGMNMLEKAFAGCDLPDHEKKYMIDVISHVIVSEKCDAAVAYHDIILVK